MQGHHVTGSPSSCKILHLTGLTTSSRTFIYQGFLQNAQPLHPTVFPSYRFPFVLQGSLHPSQLPSSYNSLRLTDFPLSCNRYLPRFPLSTSWVPFTYRVFFVILIPFILKGFLLLPGFLSFTGFSHLPDSLKLYIDFPSSSQVSFTFLSSIYLVGVTFTFLGSLNVSFNFFLSCSYKVPSYSQVSFVPNDILIGFPSSSCMSSFNNNEPCQCPGFPTSNKFSSSHSFPWICKAYAPVRLLGLLYLMVPLYYRDTNLYESLHFANFAFISGSLIS